MEQEKDWLEEARKFHDYSLSYDYRYYENLEEKEVNHKGLDTLWELYEKAIEQIKQNKKVSKEQSEKLLECIPECIDWESAEQDGVSLNLIFYTRLRKMWKEKGLVEE